MFYGARNSSVMLLLIGNSTCLLYKCGRRKIDLDAWDNSAMILKT